MVNVSGNKLMLRISVVMVLFMWGIYFAHHHLGLLANYAHLIGANDLSQGMSTLLYIFLIIPILLLVVSLFIYRNNRQAQTLPLFITLTFTFTSIGMIAAGNGFVEYHFSIFMMLALIAFFRSIPLIAMSTVIFALQHFVGYFFFPQLLCGTPDYRFSLLLIHAVYLTLTALANSVLIFHMNRTAKKAEADQKMAAKQFHNIVQQLRRTSSSVLNVSTEVDRGASETEALSSNISNSSNDLYEGAESLQDSVEKNIGYIEQLLSVTKELNDRAQSVNSNTNQTVSDIAEGATLAMTTERQFSVVKTSVDKLENHISNFQNTMNQIGRFVTDISEIADQTNLLALNASIEAARAGEAGQGFAVVAGEIRNLANESEKSAHNIQQLVSSIEKESDVIYNEMETCVNEVENGSQSMQLSKDIFDVMTHSIHAVRKEMDEILNVAQTLSVNGAKMNDSMLQMNVFSEACLNNSHETASASELQFSNAESLTEISSKLRSESVELDNLVQLINKYENKS